MGNLENKNKKRISRRDVDILIQDISSWWGKTFVFMRKTRIKTWKGIFILAFTSGIMTATIWLVSLNIQTSSDASSGAFLSLLTDETAVTLEEGKNLVYMDVLLDTNSNNVVVSKAVVNYDSSVFQLQSWDTTNSVFASDNSCVYEGKPCEIVNNDPENGKITITLAKPSPGVSTDSGIVGQLVFKALQTTSTQSPNFTLAYASSGNYEDSDVILDDGNGTDILSGVEKVTVNVYTATCTSFNYSDWGDCQPDGVQYRTVVSSLPSGCYGGDPVLEQDCVYDSVVTCESVTYSDWGACQPDGTQYRTIVSKEPEGCSEGNVILEQACTYTPPTCVSFTYSGWGQCQPDGTQTRSILSSSPAGCVGGNPATEQTCQYNGGPAVCESFTYSDWGECQSSGVQYRSVSSSLPGGCSGGNPVTERNCEFALPTCNSFAYSDWGECQSNGKRYRNAVSSSPAGCSGGSPALSESCEYEKGDGVNSDAKWNDEDEDEDDKDEEKPEFTNLPYFLSKNRGDMVWWKAKDNDEIDHYTYKLFSPVDWGSGKKEKTKKDHFFIPTSTRPGLYFLRVKVYDEAGNIKSRLITVRVK